MVCAVIVIACNAQDMTFQARYDLDVVNDTVILNDSTASFTAAVVKKDTTIQIEHRFNPDPMRLEIANRDWRICGTHLRNDLEQSHAQ